MSFELLWERRHQKFSKDDEVHAFRLSTGDVVRLRDGTLAMMNAYHPHQHVVTVISTNCSFVEIDGDMRVCFLMAAHDVAFLALRSLAQGKWPTTSAEFVAMKETTP